MNIRITFLFLILSLQQLVFAQASEKSVDPTWPSVQSLYYDYKAKKAFEKKSPEEALDYNLKILENDPDSVVTHSNLGIAFDLLQKKEESEKAFTTTLNLLEKYKDKLKPSDLFLVYYNLGVLYGTQKKVPEALKFYQDALDVNPTSIETKHNIELLIQQQQQQQKGSGDKNDDKNKDDKKDKDKKDDKDGQDDKKDDKKDKPDKGEDRKQTPKYQPRPFKGEQLSEGDVKKILGELSQQDKKIRANFNKKERKEDGHDKDW